MVAQSFFVVLMVNKWKQKYQIALDLSYYNIQFSHLPLFISYLYNQTQIKPIMPMKQKILFERRHRYISILQLFEIYKMNLITNFYGLSMEDWQRFAHAACYEINQSVKSQGEQLFYNLTKTPDTNIIITLLNNGSETVVFVLFTLLTKNPYPFAKNIANVLNLIQAIGYWQFRSFTFIRPNQMPLQKYITRTIMNALGIFLKIGYESQNTSKQLVQFLLDMKPSYFKLYLFKSFVDAVQVIDYEMGYMKYRTMLYSFQDNIIPMICQALMPFFYNIEEGVQINELSFLQQHLQVNDLETQSSSSQHQTPITNEQQQQSDYVFMLLQKIVEFNYNITYSEYQSDQAIDTCLITFPDKVAAKIINQEFLGALFFIIEKVSQAKTGGKKLEYLQISLGCVAKMMQSRLTYLDQAVRQSYLYYSLKGLTHLLLKCRQLGNEVLLEGILICNKKLYMNCELQALKKTCIKYSGDEGLDLYRTYLKDLTQMIVLVLQNSLIQAENHLLLEAVELANKIIYSHGYKEQDILDNEQTFFIDFIKAIIATFMNNLAQPTSIFKDNKISSIFQSKTLITQLFQFFKKICSANYLFSFSYLLQKVQNFIQSGLSPVVFANILYFMSQILDHNYLQRNIYLNKATDQQYCILGKLVARVIGLITEYLKSKTNLVSEESFYIDIGVILFTEALAIQFLNSFQFTTHFKVKQKLYLFMTYGEVYNETFQVEDQKSEQTINSLIYVLSQFVVNSNYNPQSQIIVNYALTAIQKCITKLKWHIKREFYLKTRIFKNLLQIFTGFFDDRCHAGDVRVRISKILVALTFDDVLDQYKFRIVKLLNIIKQEPLQLLQYDLIGIFEGIETHTISKYFYNRLKKELNIKQVVASIAQMAKNIHQEKAYKDFCRLIRSILNNKGFRINNSVVIYSLFQTLLPFLSDMLKQINRNNSINMDIWQGSIIQIMTVFKQVIGGTHVNIFMLQKCTQTNGNNNQISFIKQFLIQVMKTVILLTNQFQTYPEMEQIMLGIYYEINKQILCYIFSDESGRACQVYVLAHVKLIDTTVNYIKTMMGGNKLVQEKLTKAIDCLRYFFVYFNRKCKITHRNVDISNLKRIYKLSQKCVMGQTIQNKNYQLIDALISFLLTNNKNNYSFFKSNARLIFELNKTFNNHIINALAKIQLPGDKLKDIQNMMLMQQNQNEELFIEKIKIWVKEIDIFA